MGPTTGPTTSEATTTTSEATTTTSEATTTETPDCLEEGMIPFLNKLDKVKTATAEECQIECQLSPECEVFKWRKGKKNGSCLLMFVDYKEKSEEFTSGPRNC